MPTPSSASDERGRYRLPRSARLLANHEFRRVYGRGSRVRGRALTIVALRRRRPGHRLGVSVSKDHGPAVRRNKIKRLLREAFRLERPTLPGRYDLVLIPKPRDGKYHLDEFRREVAELIHKLDAHGGAARSGGSRKRRGPEGRRRR